MSCYRVFRGSKAGAATLAMQAGRTHPATGSSTWTPTFQQRAGFNPPLSVLPSCLPTMAPPAKAISRDTKMPAAWNPPWMLDVRVLYWPVKSNALMSLPRAEMVRIAPSRTSSPAPEELCCPSPQGPRSSPHPSSAMDQESVAMTQKPAHSLLPWQSFI